MSSRCLGSMISSLALFTVAVTATAQTSVTVAPLSELALYPDRFAPATVISLNEPMLSAQITAQVAAVPVRVGDVVKAGKVLVELDCAEYSLGRESAQASLESSQARYELAKKNFERTQSLIAKKLISIEALDASNAEFDALAASLKSSKTTLKLNHLFESRCKITAPFDALVLDRMASVSQLVTPGTAVAHLLDLDTLEISAQIFSGDADKFNSSLPLFFEANDKRYPVQLNNLLAALDSATRNREARLVFTDEAALPGSSGKLRWQDPRPHLPANFLIERGGELGFFALSASANTEPSANKESSADKEPSASKEPSANKEPSNNLASKQGTAEFHALGLAQQGRMNPVDKPLELLIITESYSGLSDGDSLTVKAAE